MSHIQPYLDYFAQHPTWAIALIFLIAFGEALLIIGLFVPSTAVLVGAGVLVGSGHLEFWPVFLATAIGAVTGDQISFWAGRFFGDRLRLMWPLNRFPQLVERGEQFVKSHGGKSIALGRFVPGVKAVVPGIVGMLGMGELYFLAVNLSSAIVWTTLHLLPGILIGQGLALAGELSGRLAIVMLELVVLLVIAGWAIRLFAAVLSPYRNHLLERISTWAKSRNGRSMHRFGRAISPENPRSLLIIFFSTALVLALVALVILVSGIVDRNAMPLGDLSLHNLMRELRNAPADEVIIPLTMLGDNFVLDAMMAAIVGWLVWRRAWRAAVASSITYLFAFYAYSWLKIFIHRPRPLNNYASAESFSFPSGHTTMAVVSFGVLAVLASHAMNRWSRSLVYAAVGLFAIAIAYSRVYLGVHWTSDVVGGLLFGVILVAAFGVAIEAIPPRRIQPYGLLAVALTAFVIAGSFHVNEGVERAELAYAPLENTYSITDTQWKATEWQRLPDHRIDLVGKSEEPFNFQWAGSLDALQSNLESHQWSFSAKWTWRNTFSYLDPNALLATVAPRPALHEGLKAKLTMILPLPNETNRRLVLRAFKTSAIADAKPVFLISLTQESLRKTMHTYAVPILLPATDEQVKQTEQDLLSGNNVSAAIESANGRSATLLTASN
jgi:membrane protein DedA with SNARE-associated domain/membrane-associated phospholipid phosphatase